MLLAMCRNTRHMGLAADIFFAKLPKPQESGVAEAKPSVSAEDRGGFGEHFERRSLDFVLCFQNALGSQTIGDVLEKNGQSARRMRLPNDTQASSGGEVPELF